MQVPFSGLRARDASAAAGEAAAGGLQGLGGRLAALAQASDLAARAAQTRLETDE